MKYLVMTIVSLIVLVMHPVFYCVEPEIQQNFINGFTEDTEDWPMFRHDVYHTGYSPSQGSMTNTTSWVQTTEDGGITSSPAIVNDKLYVGCYDHYVYCYNATTGEEIWDFLADGEIIDSAPAVYNENIYIGSAGGTFYCLDANTGQYLWSYQAYGGMFNWFISSPTVFNNRVYSGNWNGRVYCFDADPSDGIDEGLLDPYGSDFDVIWIYQTYGAIESTPAIANGFLYIGSNDGYLYCLDATTGDYSWSYDAGYYLPSISDSIINPPQGQHVSSWIYSSPTIYENKVYFTEGRGDIICIDACNGEELWIYPTGEWGSSSSPALYQNRIYSATWYVSEDPPYNEYGTLYCLDAGNGWCYWNVTIDHFIICSPAIASGSIFFGGFDTNIYCLNASFGTLIWEYQTEGYIRSSPAIAHNTLYIACYHELSQYQSYGKIYAFTRQ